jgi:endoglucanase
MQKSVFTPLVLLCTILSFISYAQQPSVFEINKNLGKGINMGNMFEAPSEAEWGNPFRDDYFKRIAELGFNHVRIPIRWDVSTRALLTAPYTINVSFFERIKYVIDKALAENLYVIINMHHHDDLFTDPEGNKARFLSQWAQIADYFKSYDHRLLFEVMNEPNSALTAVKWNVFFKDALTEIRKTNPTRAVLMGTDPWGGLGGVPDMVFPNDTNIIITVHYYEPFTFTHQGAEWVSGADAWLGTKWENTTLERDEIASSFAFLKSFAKEKNKPIHIGEFGSYSKADLESRVKWSNFLARWFESQGFSWNYWEWSAGFGIFNPSTNQYLTALSDALLKTPMLPPKQQTTVTVFEGNFGQGDGWNLFTQPGAIASISRSNGVGTIDISQIGTEQWHIQLVKNNIKLKKDSRYLVTIKGSSNVPVSVTNYLGKNSDPWNSYSGYKSISFTSSLAESIYSFEMVSPSDDFARIVFDLGSKVAKISIANIKIEEVKDVVSPYDDVMSNSIKLSPNPVNDHFTLSGIKDHSLLRILDVQGRLIKDIIYNNGNSVDVTGLDAGTYLIQIINNKGWGVKKLIKE